MEIVNLTQHQFLVDWLIFVYIKSQLMLIAYSLGVVRLTSDFIDRNQNDLLIEYFQQFHDINPIQANFPFTISENVRKPQVFCCFHVVKKQTIDWRWVLMEYPTSVEIRSGALRRHKSIRFKQRDRRSLTQKSSSRSCIQHIRKFFEK